MDEPKAGAQGPGFEENPESVSLEKITEECMDAAGYMIFASILTRKRNSKGFNLIDFKYRRYHYAYEDVVKSFIEYARAILREEFCSKEELINSLEEGLKI